MKSVRSAFALVITFLFATSAIAQVNPAEDPMGDPMAEPQPTAPTMMTPQTFTIGEVRVEGADSPAVLDFVRSTSGLTAGQTITMPGGEAIGEAIRSLYEARMFSDVEIRRENQSGETIDLVIHVEPEPRLGRYRIEGIPSSDANDIRDRSPLLQESPVRPSDIERTKRIIRDYYKEDGYINVSVEDVQTERPDGRVDVTFNVDKGERPAIRGITFHGNEAFSDGDLRSAMEEIREGSAWRFWSSRFWRNQRFHEDKYREDLRRIIDYYNEHGYYDARIERDSVHTSSEQVQIDIWVEEGNRYYVRTIDWDGNTVYPDRILTETLGIAEGEPYNGRKLQENLRGNPEGTDVSGLYMDQGYMRFNAEPTITVVGEDSLDITFDVREGETYDFGEIRISGNEKTKDHVIRRELFTVPGETFSRSAIQESIRRLMQLEYFSQESLAAGPEVSIDEQEQQANLHYSVEEVGSDQLELSGTYGRFGLVLQLGFTFNNFSAQNVFDGSAWRPLPSGDGQRLSINARTNGRFFQSYSISFTEPWFRGNPTPIGGSLSFQHFSRAPFGGVGRGGLGGLGGATQQATTGSEGSFTNMSANFFFEQRLQWPDDRFSTRTTIGHEYYNNRRNMISGLPEGVTQQMTIRQSLARNSQDNPMFPSEGSKQELSVEIAPPIGGFSQHHKWRFETDWHIPISDRITFSVGTDYGYLGTITGEDPRFGRFDVGGTPFDFSGFTFGTEPVYMRGFPARSIGPREPVTRPDGSQRLDPVGGRILNKYTSELSIMAVQSDQLRAAPYLFFDAANAWESFDTYNPAQLYRSAGIGARIFLPIVGMLEINYGYNFDEFTPPPGESGTGEPSWSFQFSIGQGQQGRR